MGRSGVILAVTVAITENLTRGGERVVLSIRIGGTDRDSDQVARKIHNGETKQHHHGCDSESVSLSKHGVQFKPSSLETQEALQPISDSW